MALSATVQTKVMQLLGYGGKTLQAGSVIYNKVLNDRLANLPNDVESLITDYLAQIAAIETQIRAAPSRLTALQIDDIKLNNTELEQLRRERKRLAREMAVLLDIPYQGTGASLGMVS